MRNDASPSLLPTTTTLDPATCALEPIHVPGAIQPHGLLVAVDEATLVIEHVSENITDLWGHAVDDLLGVHLAELVGAETAAQVRHHVETFVELRARNPLPLQIPTTDGVVDVDAVLHRLPVGTRTLLVIELEPTTELTATTFPDLYQTVRHVADVLAELRDVDAMAKVAVAEVRALTGFDRVMVYRFTESYDGEVVAESRAPGLEPFVGLRYPASDIPAQARALYEKSRVRLITDARYTPARVLPGIDRATGEPLDLTHAGLRSVSPTHLEYLRNMGVAASMSVSLMSEGRLWGLITCHHTSGPRHLPFGVRSAAEFIGTTLSERLSARAEETEAQIARRTESTLVQLLIASRDADRTLGETLTGQAASGVTLLDLVPAVGAVAVGDGRCETVGTVPDDLETLRAWVEAPGPEVVSSAHLAADHPELAAALPDVAGILAVRLPEQRALVWLRAEDVEVVTWAGHPHKHSIVVDGGVPRIAPRTSFDRWTETVRERSEPWTDQQVQAVTALRRRLLETLLLRSRWNVQAALDVQRSLLPARLPQVPGWALEARYRPSAGGEVGGDWYDALMLPDGRLAIVVGDVAGHGLAAAAAMGQLRNALRAYLLRGDSPAEAVRWMDTVARRTMDFGMATVVVAAVDVTSGEVELTVAGHPRPLTLAADGSADLLDADADRPLGIGTGHPPTTRVRIEPGGALVLYSDGLVDSRETNLRAGLARLVEAFDGQDAMDPRTVDIVLDLCRDDSSVDDVTLLVLAREP